MKFTKWQDANDNWLCADVSDLANHSAKWWIPARIMNIPLEEYVKKLIEYYEVDYIYYDRFADLLLFYWEEKNEHKCTRFMKEINKATKHCTFNC